jgi:hypothetical protein
VHIDVLVDLSHEPLDGAGAFFTAVGKDQRMSVWARVLVVARPPDPGGAAEDAELVRQETGEFPGQRTGRDEMDGDRGDGECQLGGVDEWLALAVAGGDNQHGSDTLGIVDGRDQLLHLLGGGQRDDGHVCSVPSRHDVRTRLEAEQIDDAVSDQVLAVNMELHALEHGQAGLIEDHVLGDSFAGGCAHEADAEAGEGVVTLKEGG